MNYFELSQFCKYVEDSLKSIGGLFDIMFQMQYNNFIQSSFNAIKKARQIGLGCKLVTKVSKTPTQPSNLYIELLVQKDKQILKIEQWNFKCLKTLQQSQYESNHDSQLDSVQFQKKSYFSILEQKLSKFNPKLLIKTLEPKQATLSMIISEKQLKPFTEQDIYLIGVDEFEGNGFNCHVTLQTIYSEMSKKQKQLVLESSDQQFEVLQDSTFQKEKRKAMLHQQSNQPYQNKNQQKEQIKQLSNVQQKKTQIQNNNIEKQVKAFIPNKGPQYVYMSKYSTKQIAISQYERKIEIANQTIDLIQQLNIDGDTLKDFLKKLQ